MMLLGLSGLFSFFLSTAEAHAGIVLRPGLVTQVHCTGQLFVSSVGDEKRVRLEAFPKHLGCGVALKAIREEGTTDLLLKTSAGDIHVLIRIEKQNPQLRARDLEVHLNPESPS